MQPIGAIIGILWFATSTALLAAQEVDYGVVASRVERGEIGEDAVDAAARLLVDRPPALEWAASFAATGGAYQTRVALRIWSLRGVFVEQALAARSLERSPIWSVRRDVLRLLPEKPSARSDEAVGRSITDPIALVRLEAVRAAARSLEDGDVARRAPLFIALDDRAKEVSGAALAVLLTLDAEPELATRLWPFLGQAPEDPNHVALFAFLDECAEAGWAPPEGADGAVDNDLKRIFLSLHAKAADERDAFLLDPSPLRDLAVTRTRGVLDAYWRRLAESPAAEHLVKTRARSDAERVLAMFALSGAGPDWGRRAFFRALFRGDPFGTLYPSEILPFLSGADGARLAPLLAAVLDAVVERGDAALGGTAIMNVLLRASGEELRPVIERLLASKDAIIRTRALTAGLAAGDAAARGLAIEEFRRLLAEPAASISSEVFGAAARAAADDRFALVVEAALRKTERDDETTARLVRLRARHEPGSLAFLKETLAKVRPGSFAWLAALGALIDRGDADAVDLGLRALDAAADPAVRSRLLGSVRAVRRADLGILAKKLVAERRYVVNDIPRLLEIFEGSRNGSGAAEIITEMRKMPPIGTADGLGPIFDLAVTLRRFDLVAMLLPFALTGRSEIIDESSLYAALEAAADARMSADMASVIENLPEEAERFVDPEILRVAVAMCGVEWGQRESAEAAAEAVDLLADLDSANDEAAVRTLERTMRGLALHPDRNRAIRSLLAVIEKIAFEDDVRRVGHGWEEKSRDPSRSSRADVRVQIWGRVRDLFAKRPVDPESPAFAGSSPAPLARLWRFGAGIFEEADKPVVELLLAREWLLTAKDTAVPSLLDQASLGRAAPAAMEEGDLQTVRRISSRLGRSDACARAPADTAQVSSFFRAPLAITAPRFWRGLARGEDPSRAVEWVRGRDADHLTLRGFVDAVIAASPHDAAIVLDEVKSRRGQEPWVFASRVRAAIKAGRPEAGATIAGRAAAVFRLIGDPAERDLAFLGAAAEWSSGEKVKALGELRRLLGPGESLTREQAQDFPGIETDPVGRGLVR